MSQHIKAKIDTCFQAGGINLVTAIEENGRIHLLNDFKCPHLQRGEPVLINLKAGVVIKDNRPELSE